MATWYVGINGSGTGSGNSWANAPAAVSGGSLSGLASVLSSAASGDTILLEAGVHPQVLSSLNWNKRVNLQGQTRGGANAKAIITSNRSDPWPANGVWTDGKTVGGVTYPTLTAGVMGSHIFIYKDAAAASGGSVFSWLAFRNTARPIKPTFASASVLGAVTVQNVTTRNTNGLVYIDVNTDGQCAINGTDCRSVGYSEGMFRAFNDITLTRCHGDAQNQFHSPSVNLFGSHVQDAIVGVTTGTYLFTATQCSMINHAAHAPFGSSMDPATTGHYPQGDGFVCEENTNVQNCKYLVAWGNADRGFDDKAPINPGQLTHCYLTGNGYDIAAHDDTVETWLTDSFLGTTSRPSYQSDKSAPLQASGHLNVQRCVIEQRSTGSASQYYAYYGSVQAAHTQSGVTVPQRVGQIQVFDSVVNLKSGLSKALMSPGGSPVATPQYFETDVRTVTV